MKKTYYCEKCGRMMDENNFYTSNNLEKYPNDGKLNQCKKCLTMFVDNWDPETFLPILQEIDIPYVPDQWNKLLRKYVEEGKEITGTTILGRYMSSMRLNQYKKARWADTDRLQEEARKEKEAAMRASGKTDEEIAAEFAADRDKKPPKPKTVEKQAQANPQLPEEDPDPMMDSLTEEEIIHLRLKWGSGYRADEWLRMEQLYMDMMNSYDIQGAGHIDTLIMICKASLKANQCIDRGDIEGFQKMQKAYDSLMKSGKFEDNMDYEKLCQLPLGFAQAS